MFFFFQSEQKDSQHWPCIKTSLSCFDSSFQILFTEKLLTFCNCNGCYASRLLRILTNQTISVDFSLAAIAQILPDTKKVFVTSLEGPSEVE